VAEQGEQDGELRVGDAAPPGDGDGVGVLDVLDGDHRPGGVHGVAVVVLVGHVLVVVQVTQEVCGVDDRHHRVEERLVPMPEDRGDRVDGTDRAPAVEDEVSRGERVPHDRLDRVVDLGVGALAEVRPFDRDEGGRGAGDLAGDGAALRWAGAEDEGYGQQRGAGAGHGWLS
jgi:hypothetical protein